MFFKFASTLHPAYHRVDPVTATEPMALTLVVITPLHLCYARVETCPGHWFPSTAIYTTAQHTATVPTGL